MSSAKLDTAFEKRTEHIRRKASRESEHPRKRFLVFVILSLTSLNSVSASTSPVLNVKQRFVLSSFFFQLETSTRVILGEKRS